MKHQHSTGTYAQHYNYRAQHNYVSITHDMTREIPFSFALEIY